MLESEPIGSIPRTSLLIEAMGDLASGAITSLRFDEIAQEALVNTVQLFEKTGSSVITDGEQTKSSFATYPLEGLENLVPEGAVIPFADGHTRQLPALSSGPFRYSHYADEYLRRTRNLTTLPVKQAVIAVSALSLLYPAGGIEGYTRDEFLTDLIAQGAGDIRHCLDAGAHCVQIDFTEGRLALKLDPSGGLLKDFVALNNKVLANFTDDERAKIGVHTCPGGDQDSTHSADVDYALLLPDLFAINAGRFYLQMASEADPTRALEVVKSSLRPGVKVFVGVIDPINPRVESPVEVSERLVHAASFIPPSQLGSCDDCGFAPFADDVSTSRELAFEKISARVRGTKLASQNLGV